VQDAPCVCELQSAPRELTLCQLPAQPVERDEVREGLLPVDLHDRNQLPITRLQVGVAADVDLLELEAELLSKSVHRRPRPLAEVAPLRNIEPD
jgi:hypothetical protein